ncbi:unnamed protein product [Moneuplotes crassus]|uniref:Uncharacterized protein n=1 Tax=Euplotes crassus TaxID=5936 RepID=A0AAD1XR26_EUPCR|nr:unnamed protein product [Moneuplotes crassus]
MVQQKPQKGETTVLQLEDKVARSLITAFDRKYIRASTYDGKTEMTIKMMPGLNSLKKLIKFKIPSQYKIFFSFCCLFNGRNEGLQVNIRNGPHEIKRKWTKPRFFVNKSAFTLAVDPGLKIYSKIISICKIQNVQFSQKNFTKMIILFDNTNHMIFNGCSIEEITEESKLQRPHKLEILEFLNCSNNLRRTWEDEDPVFLSILGFIKDSGLMMSLKKLKLDGLGNEELLKQQKEHYQLRGLAIMWWEAGVKLKKV